LGLAFVVTDGNRREWALPAAKPTKTFQSPAPLQARRVFTQPEPSMPPGVSMMMRMRRINWITILGAIVGFVGLLIDAVGDFQYSALPNTATFDSIRGLYQLFGAGEILFGLGFLLAFAGLAIGRQS